VRMYQIHGENYVRLLESFKEARHQERVESGAVSVIIPNYNGSASFLDDAILGMRNSFKRPEEIYFVDDRSSDENFAVLEEKAAGISDFRVHVLRNEKNLGLAATRNIGLSQVTTKYVCAHDNDNVILNRFLDVATRIMDENPEVAAVTSWTVAFNDGDHWQADSTTTLKYKWRPLGADVGLGLKENIFGDALSVYRTSDLREAGGWDGTSKALWEDWQLFLKLAAVGKQIWVIPKEMLLYRVRPTSMLQTYPKFNGWVRISNAIPGLPSNQRLGLIRSVLAPDQRLLHERWQLQQEIARLGVLESELERLRPFEGEARRLRPLEGEVQRLQAIENSATWRATARIRRWLTSHPKVRHALRRTASLTVRLAKRGGLR
jgi:GT2 family glycosyltransferase